MSRTNDYKCRINAQCIYCVGQYVYQYTLLSFQADATTFKCNKTGDDVSFEYYGMYFRSLGRVRTFHLQIQSTFASKCSYVAFRGFSMEVATRIRFVRLSVRPSVHPSNILVWAIPQQLQAGIQSTFIGSSMIKRCEYIQLLA